MTAVSEKSLLQLKKIGHRADNPCRDRRSPPQLA
jgi:hypothetical protein